MWTGLLLLVPVVLEAFVNRVLPTNVPLASSLETNILQKCRAGDGKA